MIRIKCRSQRHSVEPVLTRTVHLPFLLQMIRNLIHHPVKHNVIFNINNGEEVGLYGAAAFMKHPWSKDVKAFVNLGKCTAIVKLQAQV